MNRADRCHVSIAAMLEGAHASAGSADHAVDTPPAPNEEELKAAYKAFKKRLKFKQLDLDSHVGRFTEQLGQDEDRRH